MFHFKPKWNKGDRTFNNIKNLKFQTVPILTSHSVLYLHSVSHVPQHCKEAFSVFQKV